MRNTNATIWNTVAVNSARYYRVWSKVIDRTTNQVAHNMV